MTTVDPGSRQPRRSSPPQRTGPYEDSDVPSGDDGGASAAGAAVLVAGRTGEGAGGREGAAAGQSGRDDGCAGGRGGEVPELAVRPQGQVMELLHCSF